MERQKHQRRSISEWKKDGGSQDRQRKCSWSDRMTPRHRNPMPPSEWQVGSQTSIYNPPPWPWNISGVLYEGRREGRSSTSQQVSLSHSPHWSQNLCWTKEQIKDPQPTLRERAWQTPEFMEKELSRKDTGMKKKKIYMSSPLYKQGISVRTKKTNATGCL